MGWVGGGGEAQERWLDPGEMAGTVASVPGARRQPEWRNWNPEDEETAAAIPRTRRPRRDPGGQRVGGWRPEVAETAAGGGGERGQQLHNGRRGDHAWPQWGAQPRRPPRQTMPGAPPAELPVPLGLGDPKVRS